MGVQLLGVFWIIAACLEESFALLIILGKDIILTPLNLNYTFNYILMFDINSMY